MNRQIINRFWAPALVACGAVAATVYLASVDPNEPGHYPVCPTLMLAGVYCPGCGMLRATHDLTHLDFAGMMARNPVAPAIYIVMIVAFAAWLRARKRDRPLSWEPPRWAPWGFCAFLFLWTVARNVPGWEWASPA